MLMYVCMLAALAACCYDVLIGHPSPKVNFRWLVFQQFTVLFKGEIASFLGALGDLEHLECSRQPHIQGRGAKKRTQRAG